MNEEEIRDRSQPIIDMLDESGYSRDYGRDSSYGNSYDGGSSYARHRNRMGREICPFFLTLIA